MGYALSSHHLLGAAEWIAHITQLAIVWVAVIAMSSFALRLSWSKEYSIAGAVLLVVIQAWNACSVETKTEPALWGEAALAPGLVGSHGPS